MATRKQPRQAKARPSINNDMAITIGMLEKESLARGQQLETVVKKLEELVDKFHELTLNMTKLLTEHDGQIQELKSRQMETSLEVDEQARELAASKAQFIEAVKEVAKELAAATTNDVKAVEARLDKLESWRNKILGAVAVIAALSFFIDGPELFAKIFGG